MIENIVKGRKYRILADEANDTWDRMSFWTAAEDITLSDGTDMETKYGALYDAIDGMQGASTQLTVNTTTAEFDGKTATATNSNETLTAQFADGKCVFNLHYIGVYTIKASIGDFEFTTTVTNDKIGRIMSTTLNEVYATVNISTSSDELANAQIIVKRGGTQVGTTQFTNSQCTYKAYEAGNYSFVCTYDGDEYNYDVTVAMNQTYSGEIDTLKIVTWANGTWEQIGKMLDAHYAGKIDVADYWSVGDTKSVILTSASGASYGLEDIVSQTVEFQIIGIKHDDLSNSINSVTKAAITVQQKNCLNKKGAMNDMNSSYIYGTWSNSKRRLWCNNVYMNSALPIEIKGLIKSVNKVTAEATSDSGVVLVNSIENIFLPSNYEIHGEYYGNQVNKIDGTQYSYYTTVNNRIKNFDGSEYSWWARSGFLYNYGSGVIAEFVLTDTSGNQQSAESTFICGIAPAFCL